MPPLSAAQLFRRQAAAEAAEAITAALARLEAAAIYAQVTPIGSGVELRLRLPAGDDATHHDIHLAGPYHAALLADLLRTRPHPDPRREAELLALDPPPAPVLTPPRFRLPHHTGSPPNPPEDSPPEKVSATPAPNRTPTAATLRSQQ